MGEFISLAINTIVGSIGIILVMFLACLLVFCLDELRIKLLNIFYNTKIGNVFKQYHIFETVVGVLLLFIFLLASVEMGRQMIGVWFR